MNCQTVFLGQNSSDVLGEIINNYSPKTILLVRDRISYTVSGAEACILKAIAGRSLTVIDYFDFKENPKIEDVRNGLKLLTDNKIDLIIGIGGGSVMDMSKLIRFLYSYNTNEEFNLFTKKDDVIPLITLPTTAGTGSEATHFAVVYQNNKKYSLAHNDVMSDYAIVDRYSHIKFRHILQPYRF